MGCGFSRDRLSRDRRKTPCPRDQPEQAELKREPVLDRFWRRRLAGLVIDNRQRALGKAVDTVDFALENYSGDFGLALDFGGERDAPDGLVAALKAGDPVDRFEQTRLPQGAKHRVDRLTGEQGAGARQQSVGLAAVLGEPLFENGMDRAAFPQRGMVGIDRFKHVKLEHRAGIESERIGLEPVERGDVDHTRAVGERRAWCGAPDRHMLARLVNRCGEPLKPVVAGKTAGHRHQPEPEARGDGRRFIVAPRTGHEDLRRAQRACKIMRRKPGAKVEPGKPEIGANPGCKPRIGRRERWPHAFVHPTQDHHIGLLQARFEQTPDEDPRMTAVGRAHRALVEQLAKHRSRVVGVEQQRRGIGRSFELGEQFGGQTTIGAAPGGIAGEQGRGLAQGRSKAIERGRSVEQAVERRDPRTNPCPGGAGLLLGGEQGIERGQTGGLARTAHRKVEGPHRVEPGKAILAGGNQRVFEQSQQRDRRKRFGGRGGDTQQQGPGRALRQRRARTVVGGDPPSREQGGHA